MWSRAQIVAGALAVSIWAGEATGADVTIQLSEIPGDLTFPLPEGKNAILTATVRGGEARSAWIAQRIDSRARYLLTAAGGGQYQVNLADRALSAILSAVEGDRQFHVFVETQTGAVVSSIAVRYTVSRPASQPPRIFVHAGGKRKEIIRRLPEEFLEDLAMRAHLSGTDLWIFPTILPGALAPGASGEAYCFSPSEVESVEIEHHEDAHRPTAEIRAGERSWAFEAEPGRTLSLKLTGEIREAWKTRGEVEVSTSDDGSEETSIILRAVPTRLDLPEGRSEVTVVQRSSKEVPGSGGFLRIHVSDITAGQTLLSVVATDGRTIIEEQSLRAGEEARFQLGAAQYRLRVEELKNLLIGDDFAVISVAIAGAEEIDVAGEHEKIRALIDVLTRSGCTLVRGEKEFVGPDAADYLRRKYEVVEDEISTLDDFILKVASRSWITGQSYRIRTPDGASVPSWQWLREQARKAEADAGNQETSPQENAGL